MSDLLHDAARHDPRPLSRGADRESACGDKSFSRNETRQTPFRALCVALLASAVLAGCATGGHAPGWDRTSQTPPSVNAPAKPNAKASAKRKAPGPVTANDDAVATQGGEPRPVPHQRRRVGEATYYAPYFQGRLTASGEPYDSQAMTAAHKTLPFGTRVKVTHIDTGDSTVVRINDRGPFVDGRIIDLSEKAAQQLGMIHDGAAEVQLQILEQ